MRAIGIASGVMAMVAACGGAATQAQPGAPPSAHPAAGGHAHTPAAMCSRFAALRAEGCGGFGAMNLTDAECPQLFGAALAHLDRKDDKFIADTGACMVDHASCGDVVKCLSGLAYEDSSDLRACGDPNDTRAVGVPRADFDARNGAAVLRFHDAHSSQQQPIEMCGISGGIHWLEGLACDDGSQPIRSTADAEGSRMGNVGEGGRCRSIIDHYRVRCPEAAYDIFIDGYICPLAQ